MKFLFLSAAILMSGSALAGGGGGCQIPSLLKDKTLTCKGSYQKSSGIFSSAKSFSKTVVFDDEIVYDNSSASIHYTLYKIETYNNLDLGTGCDTIDGQRVTKYGLQYIALGDEMVLFQLGNGKTDTGVLNIKSSKGAAQVRCVLE